MKSKSTPEFEQGLKWLFLAFLLFFASSVPAMFMFRGGEWPLYVLVTFTPLLAACWIGWLAARLDGTKSEEK
ncbi:MAG: hypothetical protein IIB25_08600 [Chloroflexi bacterium]|nr:hypothetical protein [Chloroflexota bacterium]